MGAREVRGPDGRRWFVRRYRPGADDPATVTGRFRRRVRSALGGLDGASSAFELGGMFAELGEIPVVGIVFFAIAVPFLVVALVLLVVLFVLPLLFAVVEIALLGMVAGVGLGLRWSSRHPWVVEVRGADGSAQVWPAGGRWASRRLRREIAAQLASGILTPVAGTPERPSWSAPAIDRPGGR